jgi:hypothetical protein
MYLCLPQQQAVSPLNKQLSAAQAFKDSNALNM